MLLRPLRDDPADLEAARQVTAASVAALDERAGHPAGPWSAARTESYRTRTAHLVRQDPGGCWVAEQSGRTVGVALALRREHTWLLSLLAVAPDAQNAGVGRLLLERTLEYGSGCLRGMICGSPDPRAARRYRKAGFTLYPAMSLHGTVDRAALPGGDGLGVFEGGAAQLDLLDSVDRRLRGAAHGPDHGYLLPRSTLLVVDGLTGSGYCYLDPADGNRPILLAATSRRIATFLLVQALTRCPENTEVTVGHLTAEQEWAIDIGLAAGLAVRNEGYLCLRGMRPPSPYIPNGSLL